MERTVWTDERLDDRFAMIEQRFDEVIARLDRLESRIDDLYRQLTTFMIVNFTALVALMGLVVVRT